MSAVTLRRYRDVVISKRTVTWKILFAVGMEKEYILNTENIKMCLDFLPYLLNICKKLTFSFSKLV